MTYLTNKSIEHNSITTFHHPDVFLQLSSLIVPQKTQPSLNIYTLSKTRREYVHVHVYHKKENENLIEMNDKLPKLF